MLIIRKLNCIVAAPGIITLSQWSSGAQVETELVGVSWSSLQPVLSQPVHWTTTD